MNREEAITELSVLWERNGEPTDGRYREALDMAISALSAEGENDCGEWIKDHEVEDVVEKRKYTVYRCSKCGGFVESWKQSNFCPNCGADMRKEIK